MKIKKIYEYIDSIAPFDNQLDWDNSGLLIGNIDGNFTKALITLDITKDVVKEAVNIGAELIISHHPVIFKGLKQIEYNSVQAEIIKNNLTAISAHTNYDLACKGVSFTLADTIGFDNIYPALDGEVVVVTLSNKITATELAALTSKKLSASVRFADGGTPIKKIVCVGGAWDNDVNIIKQLDCDALLTGDGKYHEFLDFAENGKTLICAGHYETEFPSIISLQKQLSSKFIDASFILSHEKNIIQNIDYGY